MQSRLSRLGNDDGAFRLLYLNWRIAQLTTGLPIHCGRSYAFARNCALCSATAKMEPREQTSFDTSLLRLHRQWSYRNEPPYLGRPLSLSARGMNRKPFPMASLRIGYTTPT